MFITNQRTNHLKNPLGFDLDGITVSWTVEGTTGKRQTSARVEVSLCEDFSEIVFDSGVKSDISSLGYRVPFTPAPRTRYFWRVMVLADNGETAVSPAAWFETAKMDEPWDGKWITNAPGEDGRAPEKDTHPLFRKSFTLPAETGVRSARAYVCGLGLYELEINGAKAGDEFLAPFCNDYSTWLQYQTYDITGSLTAGENTVGVSLGNGWYKGRFGFNGPRYGIYGDAFRLICEIVVEMKDGSAVRVGSDGSWVWHPSPVLESSIYDGEVIDANLSVHGWSKPGSKRDDLPRPGSELNDLPQPGLEFDGWLPALEENEFLPNLKARLSPAVKITERRKPVELIRTPAGETVLDFGQVMTGWVEFNCGLPKGARVTLQYGEILQRGNFYNENLRSAKAEFVYISDGKPAAVRPHFTFYGFRFVNVRGMEKIELSDFTACIIHSDLAFTGKLETSDAKINRLAANALWSQRCNFLDVPTDCPQRDERMGWTGDAQIYAATASFFMETPGFYHKYMRGMEMEQAKLNGSVPFVVPDVLTHLQRSRDDDSGTDFGSSSGSCAWGDAATVIPWTLYQFYGDKELLRQHYGSMKAWVDFIKRQDDGHCGGERLWRHGFHFADWLALDNPDKESCFGGTDPYFIASAYYYYSASLTARAAEVLEIADDAESYGWLAEEVREAIRRNYFTADGRIAIDTQTAMVVSLYFDLVRPEHKARLAEDLKRKLEDNNVHLTTGFVGTPYLCPALTQNGLAGYAYSLLFNEDYPSWLYEVSMGATTIWERWNSVMPDGSMSGTGMNSLNHYAYGSIMEWVFRYVCGINPDSSAPGFKKAVIRPYPDARLGYAKAEYDSAAGKYFCGWEWKDGGIICKVTVPFDAEAAFSLPVKISGAAVDGVGCPELDGGGSVKLTAGTHVITARV